MTELLTISVFSISPLILILAILLDQVIGDPRWLPHPVRCIGSAINMVEVFLRRHFKKIGERACGILLVIIIVTLVFLITYLINKSILYFLQPLTFSLIGIFCLILLVYLTSTTIALKGLIETAGLVIKSVRDKDIESARMKLGMIVGRDTHNLSEKGVLKATMESLAENLSDGIIAPIFYLTLGGLPLAMTYKAINTLDSMVGYKDAKYINLGWAAARLDDIANYIPARITGMLIVTSTFLVIATDKIGSLFRGTNRAISPFRKFILLLNIERKRLIEYVGLGLYLALLSTYRSFLTILKDGRNHPSPNSGIPESAIAGALGVRFGGPSTYKGIVVEKPFIGIDKAKDYLWASEKAINIVRDSSLLGATIASIILYLL